MAELRDVGSRRRTRRQAVLDGLTVLFAVVAPVAIVLGFRGQLAQTGNVSHWPWDAHGIFGWWEVPLVLWLAAACSAARHRPGPLGVVTWLLLAVAALTTVALLYNP